jgi:lipopolysaccharide export system permease protein
MKVLTRYIMWEVAKGAAVAELVLLALLTFFTFTDELGDLGQQGYGLKQIFQYLALLLPREFYELMPSAALLGGIVVLGNMANHRELVAMQSAGVSKFQIIRMVLSCGVLLAAVSVAVGEYVAPVSERASRVFKNAAMNKEVAARTKYGFWVRDGNVFINIRRVISQEKLADISVYEVGDKQNLVVARHADGAKFLNPDWLLDNVGTTRFEQESVTSSHQDTMEWHSKLAPELLNAFVFQPEDQSAGELSRYVDYLKKNGQASLAAEKAYWDHFVSPVVTVTMLLVALPMVLTIGRTSSFGQRIIIGVTVGLGFYLFNRMFGHFGLIYQMDPLLTAALPTLAVFTVAGLVLVRGGR